MKHYTGDIQPEPNTIFVFGSNPEGRHGVRLLTGITMLHVTLGIKE